MTTIVVLRHAQAAPGEPDEARQLTDEGRAQALKRREALGNPTFNMVLASPAERTVTTASLVAQVPLDEVSPVLQLYCDPDSPQGKLINELYVKVGHAPPAAYYQEEGGEVVCEHGQTAWEEVRGILCALDTPGLILVVGHAPLASAMGQAACAAKPDFMIKLGRLNLGECAGYKLRFNDHLDVIDLEMIE